MTKTHINRKWILLGMTLGAWIALWDRPGAGAEPASQTPIVKPSALTSESPEVKETINRGVRWLETASDNRLGAKALVGMVMIKHGDSASHPKIVEAVQAIQKLTEGTTEPKQIVDRFHERNIIYSVGLSIVFLVNLDEQRYRREIEQLLQVLEYLQKPHGGWGYTDLPTGDTSMTQYAVLALWEAHQSGISFRLEMADNVLDWLLKTQDPSGAFGYQGVVASSTTALVKQELVKPSLSAAGLSSVYICGDMLGLVRRKRESLPPGIKEIRREERRRASRIEVRQLEAAKARGNEWLKANHSLNAYAVHYYLYALERYWSFREAAEGNADGSASWYSDTAAFLAKTQQPDGSWIGQWGLVAQRASVPDTSFSLLFLLRSTKKSIERARDFGAGLLVGGKGLPKNATALEIRAGQIMAKPLAGPGRGLMDALENVDTPEFDQAAEALADLPSDEARRLIGSNQAKLRNLLQASSSDAKVALIQALSKSDDLANVPTLIRALSDPDPTVVIAARDGLQRLSRKFDSFGPPDEFNDAQRTEAIARWKNWYRAIQPDAEFEN